MKGTRKRIEDAAKRYVKIVEWSETDSVFVGSAPPLIGPACHGDTEAEVLAQLQTIVEEWVEILLSD
jgi:predicted RNase H-like HicB family nuclease